MFFENSLPVSVAMILFSGAIEPNRCQVL